MKFISTSNIFQKISFCHKQSVSQDFKNTCVKDKYPNFYASRLKYSASLKPYSYTNYIKLPIVSRRAIYTSAMSQKMVGRIFLGHFDDDHHDVFFGKLPVVPGQRDVIISLF